MKRKIIDLEFFKGNIKIIENHFLELERKSINFQQIITEIHSNFKEISAFPLQEYRKIQVRTIRHYLKKIEYLQSLVVGYIVKSNNLINKLLDTSLLDTFSESVETHIIKKIKKDYKLTLKNRINTDYYFIFNYLGTFYCFKGKLKKILSFGDVNALQNYMQKNLKEVTIFPDPNSLKYFFPLNVKKVYLGEFTTDSKTIFICFYQKTLIKKTISNLKPIPFRRNTLVPYYFYYKGRRIYLINI
ncbi:MAG: hypothetical protein ACK4UJ_07920 [Leptonema sp. (in: bacteria)]